MGRHIIRPQMGIDKILLGMGREEVLDILGTDFINSGTGYYPDNIIY